MLVTVHAAAVVVLHLTFITTFLVIASLSRIFGAAKKQRPLYKLLYVAGLMMSVAMVLSLLGGDLVHMAWAAMALDVIGLAMGCAVTYFYWEWLPRELARG